MTKLDEIGLVEDLLFEVSQDYETGDGEPWWTPERIEARKALRGILSKWPLVKKLAEGIPSQALDVDRNYVIVRASYLRELREIVNGTDGGPS